MIKKYGTNEDIKKEKIEVNLYFKKEKFLLNNLKNEKYTYDINICKNVYVIQYKKVNKKRYKEFVVLKQFSTFRREYKITEETENKINELIQNNRGF